MAKLPSKGFKVGPGVLNWCFLNGDGSLNDMGDVPKYEYKATAVLPEKEAQPFIDALDEYWLEYNSGKVVKAKSLGYKYEEVDGNRTGNVTFTMKTNTSFKTKKGEEIPTVVKIFRGNGADITAAYHDGGKKAGNGSEGIVHGTMAIYDRNAAARGITLYLSAVQFTKFVEYAGAVDVEAVETAEDDGLGGDGDLDVTPVPQEVPEV